MISILKDSLRPVEYKSFQDRKIKGFFHLWFYTIGENSGDQYVYALIEKEDSGEMVTVDKESFRFLDRD